MVPYWASLIIWTLLNSLFCLALPALARRALYSQESAFACQSGNPPAPWAPPPRVMVGLTAALIVSDAFAYGLFMGQLGLLTAVALLAALDSQGRGRPILAGFWLALATIKVSTMLPFLLLFHRRTDLRTWAALVVFCSALCLLAGPPGSSRSGCRCRSSGSRASARQARSTTIHSRELRIPRCWASNTPSIAWACTAGA